MAYTEIPGGTSGFGGPWGAAQQAIMQGQVPALTGFGFMQLGQTPVSQATGAATGDGNVEGGGMSAPNATTRVFGSSIFQSTSGGNWAFAFRAKYASIGAARNSQFGIQSASGAHAVGINFTTATDATHWLAQIVGGATTTMANVAGTIADTNWHDFMLTDDATTVKFLIDGSVKTSTATRTNLTTEPMQPYIFNVTLGDLLVSRFFYGFVQL